MWTHCQRLLRSILILLVFAVGGRSCIAFSSCFHFDRESAARGIQIRQTTTSSESSQSVAVNDLLSDLSTPSLLVELSLAESALNQSNKSETGLDELLQDAKYLLSLQQNDDCIFDGTLFIHTRVTDTSERDKINQQSGSGKSLSIGLVDCDPNLIPGGAYLGIGLANHHVGGYYWARGMGIGASLPAHGVEFRSAASGKTTPFGGLYWKKRGPGLDASQTTEESSNSNDGKRSEWADFLAVGDTVQLVPYDSARVLCDSFFQRLIGLRRIGRPLGSDPIVERIWNRDKSTGRWIHKSPS